MTIAVTDNDKHCNFTKNIKMADAFNQTEPIGFVVDDFMKQVDLDKVMKQAEEFRRLLEMENMWSVGGAQGGCGLRKCDWSGFGRGMIGGGGVAVLPMMVSYFMMNGLLLLVIGCILAYVIYLKFNNTCCNEDCSFSLNKNIVNQMKHDVIVFVKKALLCLLHKSVSIMKSLSNVVSICHHVYSKGVEELVVGLECGGEGRSCC
jgi:hypothetical protein